MQVQNKIFETTRKLPFEVAEDPFNMNKEHPYLKFRVGTCEGVYNVEDSNYNILFLSNKKKGNGHLEDVFQWFENSCKRDGNSLVIQEVWNSKFKNHLIEKRGFKKHGADHVIKEFD